MVSVAKSKRSREIPLNDATLSMPVELNEHAADRQPIVGNTIAHADRQRKHFSRDQSPAYYKGKRLGSCA